MLLIFVSTVNAIRRNLVNTRLGDTVADGISRCSNDLLPGIRPAIARINVASRFINEEDPKAVTIVVASCRKERVILVENHEMIEPELFEFDRAHGAPLFLPELALVVRGAPRMGSVPLEVFGDIPAPLLTTIAVDSERTATVAPRTNGLVDLIVSFERASAASESRRTLIVLDSAFGLARTIYVVRFGALAWTTVRKILSANKAAPMITTA